MGELEGTRIWFAGKFFGGVMSGEDVGELDESEETEGER